MERNGVCDYGLPGVCDYTAQHTGRKVTILIPLFLIEGPGIHFFKSNLNCII